jgi:polar amino acid transport system substrate-binding protein
VRKSILLVPIVCTLLFVIAGCGGGGAKVRVATNAIWQPFEYINEETGEIEGFDIDLFQAIAEKKNLEVEFINVAWDPLLAGMERCLYDVAISCMTITSERKKYALFSDPYFTAGQIVAVHKDNSEITGKDTLVGKVVGAQYATTGALAVENMPNVTLKTYDEISWAYEDLIDGKLDAVVADNPFAIVYVNEHADALKIVGDVFTDEMYGIAVCKTKPDLLADINEGLRLVREEGVFDQLVEKWLLSQ